MIAREEREYALANTICTPSAFVTESFINEGQPSEKVCTVRLGVETKAFRPTIGTINARRARLVSGAPLQILNIGTFSFRKGMWDLAQVIKCLDPTQFRFRFVGAVAPEAAKLVSELNLLAEFVPSQPQSELPNHYSWGDIFVLPTIEDGYQLVLAQANAAGLPIATTPNGAGRDLVIEGQNGWVLSIRDPKALVTRLLWCDAHRGEVSDMVGKIYDDFKPRDWVDVAEDFEAMCYRRSNPSTELSDVVRQISSR
jgi:glycosyltransferase involved in cell wall biosynthesis